MTVTAEDLRVAARDAVGSWRDLLSRSRPSAWPWTGLPFLVAALEAARGLDPTVILGTIYFLAPLGLLRYLGRTVLDAHDPEGGSPVLSLRIRPGGLPTLVAIAITNLPLVLALGILGGGLGMLALLATVAVAAVPSIPTVRDHLAWPVLQPLLDAVLRTLAALTGLLVAGGGAAPIPWGLLLAWALWSFATESLQGLRGLSGLRGGTPALGPLGAGPRPIAVLAAVAILLAVALLARHGTLGLLAAGGVALYGLLAAMVLLAPDGALDRAVIRAARERSGLDVLVGAWLGALLLASWDVFDVDAWTALTAVATVAVGTVAFGVLITTLATRRRSPRGVGTEDGVPVPSVAIVVPAWNDAERLPACLAALRAQTYADARVLVVDLASTDGSAAEAGAWLGEDAVLVAPPIPAGWDARDWARHVGACAADADMVAFVDADTVLAPIALRVLMEHQQATGADVLTGLTRCATPTVGERAAAPSVPLAQLGLLPVWWSALSGGRPPVTAMAMASLLLVRRAAYLTAAARWSLPVEDDLRRSGAALRSPGAGAGARGTPSALTMFPSLSADTEGPPAAGAAGRVPSDVPSVAASPSVPRAVVPDTSDVAASPSTATAAADPAAVGPPSGRLDGALARAVARAGGTVRIAAAADLAATRHHRDVEEVLSAWRRRIVPDVPGGLALGVGLMLAEVAAFVLPVALPTFAILTDQPTARIAASALPLAILLVARLVLLLKQRASPTTLLWHPVTVLIALAGQAAGLVDFVRAAGRSAGTDTPRPMSPGPRSPAPSAPG